jgi:hypothetical protein
VGNEFEYKIWITNKFSRKRAYILDKQDELTLADVIEIIRNIVDVPNSFEEYCDTVVGADEDNEIDRYDYEDYSKRADRLRRVVTKKDIISIPLMEDSAEDESIDEEADEYRDFIQKVREHNLSRAQKRGDIIIHVKLQDYNRLQDYHEKLQYHGKLMKQYGYDEMTEEFNHKLFPIPKSDKELIGIRKDIEDFYKSLQEYNDYLWYLAQKYHANIKEQELSTKGVIILHDENPVKE